MASKPVGVKLGRPGASLLHSIASTAPVGSLDEEEYDIPAPAAHVGSSSGASGAHSLGGSAAQQKGAKRKRSSEEEEGGGGGATAADAGASSKRQATQVVPLRSAAPSSASSRHQEEEEEEGGGTRPSGSALVPYTGTGGGGGGGGGGATGPPGPSSAGGAASAPAPSSSSSSAPASTALVVLARPIAITKHGLRQFVESSHGMRLYLQNCVASCDMCCNPDLAHLATHARNVEYNPRRFSAAIMRLNEPKVTALLFQSGKMVVTGGKNEDDALLATRKIAKILQKLASTCAIKDFRIQNMVGTGDCGFPIRLEGLADDHVRFSSYEPELFPGLIYRMETPRIVVLVFVSGKIVLTGAKSRGALIEGLSKIYPILFKYRKTSHAGMGMGGGGGGK